MVVAIILQHTGIAKKAMRRMFGNQVREMFPAAPSVHGIMIKKKKNRSTTYPVSSCYQVPRVIVSAHSREQFYRCAARSYW